MALPAMVATRCEPISLRLRLRVGATRRGWREASRWRCTSHERIRPDGGMTKYVWQYYHGKEDSGLMDTWSRFGQQLRFVSGQEGGKGEQQNTKKYAFRETHQSGIQLLRRSLYSMPVPLRVRRLRFCFVQSFSAIFLPSTTFSQRTH